MSAVSACQGWWSSHQSQNPPRSRRRSPTSAPNWCSPDRRWCRSARCPVLNCLSSRHCSSLNRLNRPNLRSPRRGSRPTARRWLQRTNHRRSRRPTYPSSRQRTRRLAHRKSRRHGRSWPCQGHRPVTGRCHLVRSECRCADARSTLTSAHRQARFLWRRRALDRRGPLWTPPILRPPVHPPRASRCLGVVEPRGGRSRRRRRWLRRPRARRRPSR